MDTTEKIEKMKEFIVDECLIGINENIKKNNYFVEIDFNDLSKYDPELAEELLDEPKEITKIIDIALSNIELHTQKKIQPMFYNLPTSSLLPLSDVSDQLGKLFMFEGHVLKPTDIMVKCKSALFSCPSCGNTLTVLMPDCEWVEPTRCGCGRKGRFHVESRELIKFQRIEIQEALDIVPDKPTRLIKKKVILTEGLTRKEINAELQPGQKISVVGFLQLEELKKSKSTKKTNEYITTISANNISLIDTSWGAIKLTTKTKEKLKEMAENKDLLDEFSQSLAPTFEGYEMVRKSLILQHVGGKRIWDKNGNLEERGTIHVLLSGSPGSGKSYLLKKSLVISPLWHWTQGAGLTKAGLVACVTKDEYGGFTLDIGPLVMAHKGIMGLDEAEKMNKEDYGMLNNAMNDEQTKITKATVDQVLRTQTNILATSNPLHKVFTEDESIMRQLSPIPKDILDRFDVIWAMRENIDQDKLQTKYMARHMGGEETKQTWSNEDMQNYIAYAQRLTPLLNQHSADYFNKKFNKLIGGKTKERDDEISHRLRGNILRWVYAHSKFIGVGKENDSNEVNVTNDSINFAFELMKRSFKLLNLLSEEGFARFEDIEDIPSKKEVNKYYTVKETIKILGKSNKLISLQDLLLEINKEVEMDSDVFDEMIERLKKHSYIYEPVSGKISLR